jgi:hypothetical protein
MWAATQDPHGLRFARRLGDFYVFTSLLLLNRLPHQQNVYVAV